MADGVPFGNYRLQRRLARGGMAEVFLARHVGVEGFERRVAIKRILPHLSESEEFRTMFLDEARLAAQLSHPNIVHIYDFGKFDDYYYIAMEYVDGPDLGRLIRQAKARPVPFEHAARILADVCSGLHHAHQVADPNGRPLELVHRDVTPQNILVTYDGVIKLVDFGIAKAAWQAGRTRPGVVKGKFAYMSPEQVEGRSLDGRSDVFAVGVCLYELLTGVPLFRRDEVHAAMREIRDGKPILPEKFRPDVPDALVSIMRRALATSRDARYPTAGAMQLDLERYLKTADALGTSLKLAEWVRREFPRPVEPDASGGQPAERDAKNPGTEKQPQGTERQVAGTQVQTPPDPPPATSDSERSSITTAGKALLALDEDAPTLPDGDEEAPTRLVTSPEKKRRAQAFDSPRSGGTAMVPPLGHSNRRAAVAATVAALTVAGLGLLIFRPWQHAPAAEPPIVVNVAPPAPAPIVTPMPAPIPTPAPTVTPAVTPPPMPPALDILSRPPGAHVKIDGHPLAAETPIHDANVPTGLHHVTVERRGYLARELAVQLGDGERRTLDVELRPLPRHSRPVSHRPIGWLTIRTVPWAKVFEGGRLLGTTPMANVPLSEGAHTLTFVNPDRAPVERTVHVRPGEESRVSFELKK
jgi:serine/threonine-protein kinase